MKKLVFLIFVAFLNSQLLCGDKTEEIVNSIKKVIGEENWNKLIRIDREKIFDKWTKRDNSSSWLPTMVTGFGLFFFCGTSLGAFRKENLGVSNGVLLCSSLFLITLGLTASSFDNFVNQKNPKQSLYESLVE